MDGRLYHVALPQFNVLGNSGYGRSIVMKNGWMLAVAFCALIVWMVAQMAINHNLNERIAILESQR